MPLQHIPSPLHGIAKHYLCSHDIFSPQQALFSSLHSPLHIKQYRLLFSERHFQVSVPYTQGMKQRTCTFPPFVALQSHSKTKIKQVYLKYFLQLLHSLFISYFIMDCLATVFNYRLHDLRGQRTALACHFLPSLWPTETKQKSGASAPVTGYCSR